MIKHLPPLLRVGQWYKNLILFVPWLFLDNKAVYPWSLWILAFIGFCAVSSLTYMINDWVDREEDRLHPTKKYRPLASGKVSGTTALGVGIVITMIVGAIMWQLGTYYSLLVGSYFILTNLYSFGLKHVPILDSLMIAGNFALRMMAGAPYLPNQNTAPYFILVFSVIFIFLTHKRRSDIKLLGEKAIQHKKVLRFYTPLRSYVIRILGYLGVGYAGIMLWQSGIPEIKIIVPIGFLALTGAIFSRKPELVIKPHYLFKEWWWVAGLLVTILIETF